MHEIVRGFRGEQRWIGRRRFQSLSVEFSSSDGAGCNRNHVRDLIVVSEERFFVLLEIALVARRQALQRREQPEQSSGDAAGFAANQFPGIRIFLLRHQAAAGGILVWQNDVRKFLRRKNYEVFCEPRKMCSDSREGKKIIEREVPVAHGIEAVRGNARKPQFARNGIAINRE